MLADAFAIEEDFEILGSDNRQWAMPTASPMRA